jgi:hypothetical protein
VATAPILNRNQLRVTSEDLQCVLGVESMSEGCFPLGSCPKLFAHRLVRLSAGKVPHFANLGGPSSAAKTSIQDDKGES